MVSDGQPRENLSTEGSNAAHNGGPPVSTPNAGKAPARFAFVDGLRGLAALGIVIFHIWWYEPLPQAALQTSHWMVDEAIEKARGSVQILLVISGFVIAYTLRRTWFTVSEVYSFIGRRVVRLVPAYWVTIGIVLLVDILCRRLSGLPSPFTGQATPTRIAAHMTFLQGIFAFDAIGAGMWTLCIEMQFYIVAVLGWGLAQRLFARPDPNQPRPSPWGLMIVFAPAALVSLFLWRLLESTDPWVTHFLWMFFLGMITWWALDRTISLPIFAVVVLIGGLELIYGVKIVEEPKPFRYENSLALATALVIFTAGMRDRLHVWLNWSPLQYLGRISYSLYLIHFPVCHLLTTAGWKMMNDAPTPLQARVILLAGIPASILAGHLMYILVEAPSSRWAGRMKRSTI